MTDRKTEAESLEENDADVLDLPDHPKGTLAVMLVYALLFIVGWIGLYLFVFVGRGTPQP